MDRAKSKLEIKNIEFISIKMAFNAVRLAFFWELKIEKGERIRLQGKSTFLGLEEEENSTEDEDTYLSFETFREDVPERAQPGGSWDQQKVSR